MCTNNTLPTFRDTRQGTFANCDRYWAQCHPKRSTGTGLIQEPTREPIRKGPDPECLDFVPFVFGAWKYAAKGERNKWLDYEQE